MKSKIWLPALIALGLFSTHAAENAGQSFLPSEVRFEIPVSASSSRWDLYCAPLSRASAKESAYNPEYRKQALALGKVNSGGTGSGFAPALNALAEGECAGWDLYLQLKDLGTRKSACASEARGNKPPSCGCASDEGVLAARRKFVEGLAGYVSHWKDQDEEERTRAELGIRRDFASARGAFAGFARECSKKSPDRRRLSALQSQIKGSLASLYRKTEDLSRDMKSARDFAGALSAPGKESKAPSSGAALKELIDAEQRAKANAQVGGARDAERDAPSAYGPKPSPE